MKESVRLIFEELFERYPVLSSVKDDIAEAYEILADCYSHGGWLLVGGNGGSAADAEHIVGELMKRFKKARPVGDDFRKKLTEAFRLQGEDAAPRAERLADTLECSLPAIAVTGHPALTTAFINDSGTTAAFAQQVLGYGRAGDVFLGISTSGGSSNVLEAAAVAKALGLKVIGLSGRDGGQLRLAADVIIIVPESETYRIQELHLPIYHALCSMLEETFF